MENKNDYSQELIKLLLPSEIFEYFEIVDLQVTSSSINVHLEELNLPPEEYRGEKITSKGFHSVSVVQDFPIRNKSVYLHIKRRRWLVESSNIVVSRNWNTVAKGTRYTKGFATFLKGLFGQIPDKL